MSSPISDGANIDGATVATPKHVNGTSGVSAIATEPVGGQEITTRPLGRIKGWELGLVTVLCLALYLPKLGSYNLWDPWETHYGEVARRMIAEHDWIHLRWQNESFRSKPVLTFWLMAAGMKALGVAEDGGYSGELISSHRTEWAIRLPFALFGVAGIVMLWFALARLYSKRAAWLASVILATCPYYFMIARQAITDMPSCSMFIGSMSLFALAVFDDRPLKKGFNAHHIFLAAFGLIVLGQIIYFIPHLRFDRVMFTPKTGLPGIYVMILFLIAFVGVSAWSLFNTRSTRQVYMYWFYLLNGVAVLAKGPVAPALGGLIIIFYLIVTGEWKKLLEWEIPRGVLMAAIICLPWHFGMYMKDGMGWLNEYLGQHIFGRAFAGVFGDRGTFNYYLTELGPGMWPWICLVPVALGTYLLAGRPRTRDEKLRLIFVLWGIVGFGFFAFVQTKFHHYLLPAVPGFAVVVAFWLDDLWSKKITAAGVGLFVAAVLFVITSVDLVGHQEKLVHLFTFRYDRPWPSGPPYNIDFGPVLLVFAAVFGAVLLLMFWPRVRKAATIGLVSVAGIFAVFCVDILLVAASPHWGQRHLHEVYYKNREIHGVDLIYYGGHELENDWAGGRDLVVRSVIPTTLHVGDPMAITWQMRSAGEKPAEQGELAGTVATIDEAGDRFTIHVPAEERAKLASELEKNQGATDDRRRFISVNADRMIAWQLNWRGENFYSGGEIWNPRDEDMQTVFVDITNDKFLDYLKPREGKGRKFWVVTEIGRVDGLRNILPTQTAKDTFQKPDPQNNKFGLATFTLDFAGKAPIQTP